MSKLSFRARALDAAKPLPIYRGKDMPDLNDCVSINRAVPQMPTGMEKEEESRLIFIRFESGLTVYELFSNVAPCRVDSKYTVKKFFNEERSPLQCQPTVYWIGCLEVVVVRKG
ncbi:UNVERIFIED_CONTAM: hypothetical protein K2H54_034489 [Gekko kuhli]